MFFKKAEKVAKEQTAKEVKPEPLVEVESSEPEPTYEDYQETEEKEVSEEVEDEVAEMERKLEEAKARKKAKEEAEQVKEVPEGTENALQDILRSFDSRLTLIEADLYKLTRR